MARSASKRQVKDKTSGSLVVRPRGTVGGGRAIGQQNKISAQAKDNIVEVFLKIGGVAEMAKWAKANRGDFYGKIYARLIPKDVQLGASEGLEAMLAKLAEQQSGGEILGDYTEVTPEEAK